MCGRGSMHWGGVLTVNLLTPDADNEGDERASMKTEPRHH